MKDENKHEYLEGSLTACSFSKTTGMSFQFPSEPMFSQSWTLDQVSSRRHEFPPVEWTSISTRKQLVTSIIVMKGWPSLAM